MKNVRTLAYLMAITMVSTVGFVSCKDKNAPEENKTNQTQQAEMGVVKTEFSIALPEQLADSRMPRRMPSGTVQKKGMDQFNGLTGITLVPFGKQGLIDLSSDTRLGTKNIQLDDLTKPQVSGKNHQAKVYNDVEIPLNTASFLFYAKSGAANTGVDGKFSAGSLIAKTAGSATNWATDAPASLTFDLEAIAPSYVSSLAAAQTGGKLLEYLSSIACASDGQTTPKLWYQYTAGDDAAMKAMFDTYTDLRYLSSFGVARVLTDLYKSLLPLSSPIATGIKAAINNPTYATIDGSNNVKLIDALKDYPHEINLPDGAISIRWDDANHKFIEGLYPNMTHPENFVYPAQLWYYANSQIKTSNTSKKTMYDLTDKDWQYILDAHTDAISVNSLTRAVAIEKQIQYAVARFDVTVKLDAASMADNSEHAEGKATPVDVSAGFPVKAVFVGGQQQVKYDFTTNGGTEYTIYDRTMADTWTATTADPVLTGDHPEINHTLVLENGTANVRIAIELENTADDFYGYDDQLIPHGGKFYVCAELNHELATETGGHVFKQDFTTTANLTLKNLQKAYSTLPDLRTPKLELGFSVNLEWRAGHTYNIYFE